MPRSNQSARTPGPGRSSATGRATRSATGRATRSATDRATDRATGRTIRPTTGRTIRLAAPLTVLFAAALPACGNGGGDGELRVATYNAGLAPGFVGHVAERAPLVASALAGLEADVLCVQELWQSADWSELVEASEATFPHAHRRPDDPGEATEVCAPGELDGLEVCVREHCEGLGSDELTNCALGSCGEEIGAISTGCLTCLTANVGAESLDAIRTACETAGTASYAYGGSFGTGILSRLEPDEVDSLLLPSSINRRAVLYARLDVSELGDVHFFCTHLSANLETVPYNGDFGSWEAEQAAQVDMTLDWIEGRSGGGRVVLAGDLNNGPALEGIDADLPGNYAKWLEAGFRNPYAEQPSPACTYCDDNPLNEGTMAGGGNLIDHILVRRLGADGARRILDEPVEIEAGGETLATAYSDHFGLHATVKRP